MVEKKESDSDKMWNEIKNLPINVFGLTDRVLNYAKKIDLESPGELYLSLKASAVVPALEESLGKKFSVETADKYIIVRRNEDRDAKVRQAMSDAVNKSSAVNK